jgi:hypothetical protein
MKETNQASTAQARMIYRCANTWRAGFGFMFVIPVFTWWIYCALLFIFAAEPDGIVVSGLFLMPLLVLPLIGFIALSICCRILERRFALREGDAPSRTSAA